ncbi:DUF3298 and DUF4163 domain-containing protein [Flavobacterium sp. MAH-1]|uniref:DUF3298 and DUF4163 domain-containing protein n=1 Tax=Flavobacterium agri TaxID=2743471 RepID=A0A7Y8Y2R0_9FLAO|nr:DUF3298 and DUF4163 domain-containing protein [Flavobacterium agri]NUY81281.1 DUF3298 and DUF4163 domain-containing protein [Flavobacterium agri]NYA71305.1 DUF3298 and DUF4163 domain-containing protein [Flavobacterium agri]
MKPYFYCFLSIFVFASCSKDLEFETKTFEKRTSLKCQGLCPKITIKVPVASNGFIADSINNKIFSKLKEIVYFGEEPYQSKDYQELANDFIASYEKMQKEDPDELIGWEGDVNSRLVYRSQKVLDIEIQHYTFTGGAHGYSGKTSLIFNLETGKSIPNDSLFTDVKAVTKLAEKHFREKFKIPENAPINSGGLMFENEKFALPATIFFSDKGVLLYYNTYEIASYADGPRDVMLPYSELGTLLKIK